MDNNFALTEGWVSVRADQDGRLNISVGTFLLFLFLVFVSVGAVVVVVVVV